MIMMVLCFIIPCHAGFSISKITKNNIRLLQGWPSNLYIASKSRHPAQNHRQGKGQPTGQDHVLKMNPPLKTIPL